MKANQWRVRVYRKRNYRDVLTYTAQDKQELHRIISNDDTILFAETTGGDGHTANDLILDRR